MLSWVSALQSVTPTGIEPVLPPWKGDVLTAWPWSHIYLLHKNILHKITPRVGLEPTTTRLTAECSTIELSRNNTWYTTAYSSSLTQIQVDVNTFYFMYLQNFIQKVLRLHLLQSLSRLSFEPLRISLRPISICQLNALPHLHLRPINLVVFKGSYFFKEWDI